MKTSLLWLALLVGSLGLGCASGGGSDASDIVSGEGGSDGEGGSNPTGGTTGVAGDGGKAGSSTAGSGGSTEAGSGGSEQGGTEQGGSAGSEAAGSGGSNGGSGGATTGCGDGKKDDKEQCDGADLGGQTCGTTLGAEYGGKLGCKTNCQFDFAGCAKNPVCGDGAINVNGEECDDSDFGGKTCAKVLNQPNATGALTCSNSCKIDSSGCKQGPFCGDNNKGDGEECDGDDVGTATCASATGDPNKGGFLKCSADCKLDTSGCVDNPKCGDGKVNNTGEQCDGADLVGATCKSALGNQKAEGTVACGADCKFDTSGCTIPPYCGDGKKGSDENCDGNDFGGATCESVLGKGHDGQLVCSPDCTISSAKCEVVPYCGDGIKNASEQCDAADLGSATCASAVGPGSTGTISCNSDCSLDVSQCSVPPNCGNGTIDADKGEQCDGSQFGGKTCASILGDSKAVGSLVCTGACTIDSSGCSIPPYCGDGKLNQASEECDDGNTKNGDGCNSSCKVVCFTGESKFGTHCYVDSWDFDTDYSLGWDDAEGYCVQGGGHLVSISSQNEYDFLFSTVLNTGLFAPNRRWIGFNDKVSEGVFGWSSGEPVQIIPPWDTGEPNNGGSSGNEDCGELYVSDGSWNDRNCSTAQAYICEFPPPVLYP